jgi:HEAT repeat protein
MTKKLLYAAVWFLFAVSLVDAQTFEQELKSLIDKITANKCQPNIWDRSTVRHPQERCLMDSAARLGLMGQDARPAVPALIEALKTYPNLETGDGILAVRSIIAKALGEIGDESAVPALMDILRSEDKVSISPTASLLPSYKPQSRSSYGSVIGALGMLKAKEALPLLAPFLKCSEDAVENSLVWCV